MSDSESLESQRELAAHNAALEAWVQTRFEVDRQLLTLSVAGIGFLVTLLTTVGSKGLLENVLVSFAVGGFLICAISILTIFHQNASYLELVVQQKPTESKKKLLTFLDRVATGFFAAAIVASIGVGVHKSESSATKGDIQMSDEETIKQVIDNQNDVLRSLAGFEALLPKPPAKPATKPVEVPAEVPANGPSSNTSTTDASKPKGT